MNRPRSSPCWCALACLLLIASIVRADAAPFEWRAADPASQGFSPEKLTAFRDHLAKLGTRALLVIRHDRVVCEWYADGVTPEKPQGTASLAKSLVGGMSLALAITDGRLRPDDLASDYIPEWKSDPRKSKITIAQLASHTSGLEDAEADNLPHDKLPGWKGEFWAQKPTDPFTISRDQTPAIYDPGQRAAYSNPGMAMLAYAVTASLKDAPEKDLRTLLRDRVLRPIGVPDREWSVGYGKTFHAGGLDLVADWGGAAFSPRATARLGRLTLRKGDWDGQRLLDPKAIDTILNYHSAATLTNWSGPDSPRPVLGWYTNADRAWPTAPPDAFCGLGAGHQFLLVIPSLDLILVRNGTQIGQRGASWANTKREIVDPLMATLADPPHPPSDVIKRVRFDPPETILRQAIDSDNWPLTWADDGAIYTAYGDGRGFEPFVEKKLSLGLATIEGTPPHITGTNLRSPTAERTGNGPKGPKASGMLMVDGVLYLWARNTNNSTLAWSPDRGHTWQWGFTFTEGFGCPTFLNFGPNYAGARDDYVYVYSQDGPSAYETYDAVALARVPKARIREQGAYEWFVKLAPDGSPVWTSDLNHRGPAFAYPAHCQRVDAAYNPGLRRYLLAVSYGHAGGWGLFDAPAPWGPWTTAFSTQAWDQGQTHGYRLPTKWISDDGRTLWVVFSGLKPNDAFCLRRMTLETSPR
jgi:CubicO group peptidase (beta-lactamase class C family)